MASVATQVILKRDVLNLGRIGDVVKVKPGYARNFLYPKLMALPVSPERVAHFVHQKRIVEAQLKTLKVASEKIRDAIADVQITLKGKAGESGKLFGSIGTRDITTGLAEAGFVVDHRDVKLEHPIKDVGLHTIEVRLEADVKAKVNVVVVPEVDLEEVKAAEEGEDVEESDEQAEESAESADDAAEATSEEESVEEAAAE